MNNYTVSTIYPSDKAAMKKVDLLLEQEGIKRDQNLDYTCAIYNDSMEIIATGSLYKNTMRCLAVDSSYQGESLLNLIMTKLINEQYSRGNQHFFVYTKIETQDFFTSLGFHQVAKVEDRLVFLENLSNGFETYLNSLERPSGSFTNVGSIVLNANPFTLGHMYLIERASSENDLVHVFIVSEDESFFPYEVRRRLLVDGTSDLDNLIYHETGPYIISNATFPSYFLEDEESVILSHAKLDVEIFTKIASKLGITRRYVGEEKTSQVTGIYNKVMKEDLTKAGLDLIEIKRKSISDQTISASTVRLAIKNEKIDQIKEMLPEETYKFLISDEARPIIDQIQNSSNVIHY